MSGGVGKTRRWSWVPGTYLWVSAQRERERERERKKGRRPLKGTEGCEISFSPRKNRLKQFLPREAIMMTVLLVLFLLFPPFALSQVEQRNLVVSDSTRFYTMSFCESNSTSSFHFNERLPFGATLHLTLNSSKWIACSSSGALETQNNHWQISRMEYSLNGNGAHRQLSSLVIFEVQHEEALNDCHLIMIEKLSNGVFVDKFELEGLVNRQVFEKAQVLGDVNLELPTLHSVQSIVILQNKIDVRSATSANQYRKLQAEVVLPLHARYPPLNDERYGLVEISLPSWLLYCSVDASSNDREMTRSEWSWIHVKWDPLHSPEQSYLKWAVPAGNPLHFPYVSTLTATAALLGAMSLCLVSRQHATTRKS